MKNVFYVLLGVMAGFALAGMLVFVSRMPVGEPIILYPQPTKSPMVVYVVGAVVRPGLYEIDHGGRVQNAINAAGGLLPEANIEALNLASILEDGKQLVIPYHDGREMPTKEGTIDLQSMNNTKTVDGLVNINTASGEELNTLPGIGPTTALKIIDYRIKNGGFSTIDEIMNVSGIGPATFEGIKDLITN